MSMLNSIFFFNTPSSFLWIFFFTIFLFTGIPKSYSGDYWSKQQTPVNTLLTKCSFVDSLNGWVTGDEGVILHTSNGGTNWQLQDSKINFKIYDVHFINPRLGWAVANDNFAAGTAILSTTNGGINWYHYRYPDNSFLLYTIYFKDSLNGFMGGYGGKLLRTTNSGMNWIFCKVDSSLFSSFPVLSISFYDFNLGFATGGSIDLAGVIWKTSNGGITWRSFQASFEPVYSIYFLNSSKLIAAGGDYKFGTIISKSTDSGLHWNFEPLNIFGIAKGISFRTSTEGWMVLSFSENFAYTLDSGKKWNLMNVPGNNALHDISFTDSLHGYSVGSNGSIYRYNSSAMAINNIENFIPLKNRLIDNYPNPFNPKTIIRYEIAKTDIVSLKIYDVTGKEMITLVNKRQSAGNYNVEFDAMRHNIEFPSGVYFCILKTEDFTQSKSIILLR